MFNSVFVKYLELRLYLDKHCKCFHKYLFFTSDTLYYCFMIWPIPAPLELIITIISHLILNIYQNLLQVEKEIRHY